MTDFQKQQIQQLRYEGNGYKKIAQILDLSENTVKSYCKRNHAISNKITCLHCGQELDQKAHRKPKKFCSDQCRMRWWNAHPELVKRKSYYAFTCKNCGIPFESYGNSNRKYCSRTCYGKSKRKENSHAKG